MVSVSICLCLCLDMSMSLYVSLSLSRYVSVSNGRNRILPFYTQWRRPGAEFGRERKNFSRTKISELRFFPEKISIFTSKISDDFFFRHRPGFSGFTFLYCIKILYTTFSSEEKPLFQKRIP